MLADLRHHQEQGKEESVNMSLLTDCQCSYTMSCIPAYRVGKVFSVPGVIYQDVSEDTPAKPFQ